LKKTKINQFSLNAAPSSRIEKKDLDKIDMSLDVEFESAIKSRGRFPFKISKLLPTPSQGESERRLTFAG